MQHTLWFLHLSQLSNMRWFQFLQDLLEHHFIPHFFVPLSLSFSLALSLFLSSLLPSSPSFSLFSPPPYSAWCMWAYRPTSHNLILNFLWDTILICIKKHYNLSEDAFAVVVINTLIVLIQNIFSHTLENSHYTV